MSYGHHSGLLQRMMTSEQMEHPMVEYGKHVLVYRLLDNIVYV